MSYSRCWFAWNEATGCANHVTVLVVVEHASGDVGGAAVCVVLGDFVGWKGVAPGENATNGYRQRGQPRPTLPRRADGIQLTRGRKPVTIPFCSL